MERVLILNWGVVVLLLFSFGIVILCFSEKFRLIIASYQIRVPGLYGNLWPLEGHKLNLEIQGPLQYDPRKRG